MKLSKIKAAALATVCLTDAIFVTPASAHLANSTITYYFSDANLTGLVGDKWTNCNGTHVTEGTVTAYTIVEDYSCGDTGYECYLGSCFIGNASIDRPVLKHVVPAIRPTERLVLVHESRPAQPDSLVLAS